jgi:outer membrane immunogenic protein
LHGGHSRKNNLADLANSDVNCSHRTRLSRGAKTSIRIRDYRPRGAGAPGNWRQGLKRGQAAMPGLLVPRKVAASWGGGAVAALAFASFNAGSVTLSFAADMSTPAPVYTKAPVAPQASWTGFYLGGSVGFRSLRSDGTTTSLVQDSVPIDLTLAAVSEPLDGTAVRLSPYLGYNWQVAPQWVLGVEGDLGFANQITRLNGFVFSTNSFSNFDLNADSFALKATWDASLRGRVGYLLTPSSLVYLSGGVAWQHYSVISTCIDNDTRNIICAENQSTPAIVTGAITRTGWTVGAGLEAALGSNWLARAEYRYADFGSSSFTIARTGNGNDFSSLVDQFEVALKTHTVAFGVAYKFGDPLPSGTADHWHASFATKAASASWSGPYVGLGLGVRASDSNAIARSTSEGGFQFDLTGTAVSEPMNGIAFRAAPYAGYNWQINSRWLLGIEGDFGFANRTTTLGGFPFSPGVATFSDGGADGLAVKTTWDASLRGRAGYLVTPTSLVYLTGGAAWQHYDVTSTCASIECTVDFGFLPPLVITNSFTRPGWTVGGGFETALSGNWFMRADYRFADFGASHVTLTRASTFVDVNPTIDAFDQTMRTHTATLGLAYKFDWTMIR